RSDHPTQGLLDMLTLRQAKGDDFARLKILLVGDVRHSRVARSDLHALRALGAGRGPGGELRVCGPAALLPEDDTLAGCSVGHDLDAAIEGVDAVMMLRLQRERMQGAFLPSEREYFHLYGLTEEKLAVAKPDAIVMHPGPINRGVEIASGVADGARSVILQQVTHGAAVRMAIMALVLRPGVERE
ncbi:MAG: aspartate carbamoyltransferase catalytic subunit, partial [Gammaproteobacteria bacterium]